MNDPMGSLERFYDSCDSVEPPSVGLPMRPVRRGAAWTVARALAQLASGFVAAAVALSLAGSWQAPGEPAPNARPVLSRQYREAGLTIEDLTPLVVPARRSSEARSWRA